MHGPQFIKYLVRGWNVDSFMGSVTFRHVAVVHSEVVVIGLGLDIDDTQLKGS